MTSILSKIASGVVKDWSTAVTTIEADAAKAEKWLAGQPQAQAAIAVITSDVKQGASDLLGLGGTLLGDAGPILAKGVEAAADSGLTAVLGPTPLTGAAIAITNNTIDGVVEAIVKNAQAWALAKKASLAPPVLVGSSSIASASGQSGG